MTAQQLIDDVLLSINVIAAGETPAATERSDALKALQRLIESWGGSDIANPSLVSETFPLSGASAYTIGPGGMFNTARPVRIRSIACTFAGGTRPVELLAAEKWDTIFQRNVTGNWVERAFWDARFPLSTLYVSPVAPTGANLHIISFKPITPPGALTDEIVLPPPYLRALKWALAIETWPQYSQNPVPQAVAQANAESLGILRDTNSKILGEPLQAAEIQETIAKNAK